MTALRGHAWTFGRDVDTDLIIAARYLNIMVAKENFGCGSSREHAPMALKGAGVSLVIAKSFARIFYRNAFNTGLPILVAPEAVDGIKQGDELTVDLTTGEIDDLTSGAKYQAQPLPPFMQELVAAGGLLPYLKARTAKVEGKS
jgi:3-isopropylmalate/(R)-2-methylmalate dehydratase small subunit